jgi:predicted transcriptional regulator
MTNNLYTQFDNVFFEKTRLSLITIIYKEELVSFKRLKKIINASDGALYTHLQKLIDSEYIGLKREIVGSKAQSFYFITKSGKKLFKKYLKFLETIIE